MNLYEFEGKQLFARYGIPVPAGEMIYGPELPASLPFPFVIKAQVLTGGRGKAGGVRVCADEAAFRRDAGEVLALNIKGHTVRGLLCEEKMKAEQEFYLSITLQGVDTPTLIISRAGGMEIEEVAKTDPDKILKIAIDPFTHLKDYQLKYIAQEMALADSSELVAFLRKVEHAFFDLQAMLVEINPLGVVGGKLVAMDAKVVLDDHASRAVPVMEALLAERTRLVNWKPEEKETTTITYVPLDGGNIALISDGAGTGMLTLDLLTDEGGEVASFCELGGTTPAEVMYRAMQYSLERRDDIKSVMVVLIGGFNRMDDMANGITGYLRDHNVNIPIFTRMCGTMEETGKQIMAEAGLKTYDDLAETVRAAVEAAREV